MNVVPGLLTCPPSPELGRLPACQYTPKYPTPHLYHMSPPIWGYPLFVKICIIVLFGVFGGFVNLAFLTFLGVFGDFWSFVKKGVKMLKNTPILEISKKGG